MSPPIISTPRLGLAVALLIWGGFTGHLLPSLAMAVIVEYPGFSRWRWEIADKEFCRVADLSTVLFALVAVLQFTDYSIHAIYKILELLPYCVFPLIVSQQFGATKTIPLSALLIGLRREVRAGRRADQRVNLAPVYIIACLLAASSGKAPGYWFFCIASIAVIGMLATTRPRRYPISFWGDAVVIALMVAFVTQNGIRIGQQNIEDAFLYWLNQYAWLQPNPDLAITAIGSIGRLKFSDRIRVRVLPSKSARIPLLLQEASYSTFHLGVWSAKDSRYQALEAPRGTKSWQWSDDPKGDVERLDMSFDHRYELSVVPVPRGTFRLTGDDIVEIQRNNYGTTLAEAKPGQLDFRADFLDGTDLEPAPRSLDLVIPAEYRDLIDGVSVQLGLPGLESRNAVRAITGYFSRNFKYSLIQKGFYPGKTPLAYFLSRGHKGHCEYFATSTVLLLRAAGIPARYTVGYVVQEYSELENAYVARARHAHSWASAFVDGHWITVDTTPGVWFELEDEAASDWQTAQDIWSWLSYRYQRLRRMDKAALRSRLGWFVPPLVIFLAWRLRRNARSASGTKTETMIAGPIDGADSDLYELVTHLARRGVLPAKGDTLRNFLMRHAAPARHGIKLPRLIALHYKYRFARAGLTATERHELKRDVNRYISSG